MTLPPETRHPDEAAPPPGSGAHLLALAAQAEQLAVLNAELDAQGEELREAQRRAILVSERWNLMFERLAVPMLLVDSQALVLRANLKAQEWFGEEGKFHLPSRQFVAAIDLRARAAFVDGLRNATELASTEIASLELTSVTGQSLLVDAEVQRMPPEEGQAPQWVVLLKDRTHEIERRNERSLFYSLIDSTEDGIFAVDPEGRFLLVNRAVERLLQLRREDILGRTRDKVMPLRDAIVNLADDQTVIREGRPIEVREELHGPVPGERRVFSVNKFPVFDSQGKLLAVGGVARDVTEEAAQRELLQLSDLVFKHSSDAIVITDTDTRVRRANKAFERLSGFNQDRLVGRRISILRSGHQTNVLYKEMWFALERHGHWGGELTNRNADGGLYTVWCSISALYDESRAVIGYMAIQTDLTELRRAQAAEQKLATHDALTGLPNRTVMLDRLTMALSIARRRGRTLSVMFLDLDEFKEVNDTMGHSVGDSLLQEVARRLTENLRAEDTVARIGGDEFVVLLPEADSAVAGGVAHKLLRALEEPVRLGETMEYRPRCSVGYATFPHDGDRPELLLRNADMAMYAAKDDGRHRAVAFSRDLSDQAEAFFEIRNAILPAIANGELRVFLQPKFRIGDGTVVGAEALVRWERPGLGLLQPAQFLPAVTKAGLITAVDGWMLDQCVALLQRWHQEGLLPPAWRLSVNQAALDIQKPGWLPHLQDHMTRVQFPPEALEIELIEDTLAQPTPIILTNLNGLRNIGVWLSVDDFGTGYSNMAYLKSLPISVIKIDQSFIRDMMVDPSDHSVVEAVISLSRKLGHTTVAEGVETEVQRKELQRLGCDLGQGYLVSRPIAIEAFEKAFLEPAALESVAPDPGVDPAASNPGGCCDGQV